LIILTLNVSAVDRIVTFGIESMLQQSKTFFINDINIYHNQFICHLDNIRIQQILKIGGGH